MVPPYFAKDAHASCLTEYSFLYSCRCNVRQFRCSLLRKNPPIQCRALRCIHVSLLQAPLTIRLLSVWGVGQLLLPITALYQVLPPHCKFFLTESQGINSESYMALYKANHNCHNDGNGSAYKEHRLELNLKLKPLPPLKPCCCQSA